MPDQTTAVLDWTEWLLAHLRRHRHSRRRLHHLRLHPHSPRLRPLRCHHCLHSRHLQTQDY